MAMSRAAGSMSFTTRSPILQVPDVMVSNPAIMRSSVDFPQPDGPSSTVKEPFGTVRETPRTASTLPG
jgi:hypothetical protein